MHRTSGCCSTQAGFLEKIDMESCKDIAQHRKRLNEDSFMIEKGEEPRSSAVKMKIRAKK